MSYFRNFPNVEIPIDGNPVSVKDVIRRVKFADDVFENQSNFEYYRLSDGETLKDVANKVYGDPTLDWTIILFNGLTDPFYSTPLTTNQFEDFINTKYSGQSLFCSPVGSSLPFFLNAGSFDEGDLVSEKTLGLNNERIFSDDTKSATVKNIDPSMGKIQVTSPVGSFNTGDLIVNRTQFDYTPENTVSNSGSTQEYTIAVDYETVTTNTPWTPGLNSNGILSAWYRSENIGTTKTSGVTNSGGETLVRVNTWENSSNLSNLDLSCITAEFMPMSGTNGYNDYSYVKCNLKTINGAATGVTAGSFLAFDNPLGDYGITTGDMAVFMLINYTDDPNTEGVTPETVQFGCEESRLFTIPSQVHIATDVVVDDNYLDRFLSAGLGVVGKLNPQGQLTSITPNQYIALRFPGYPLSGVNPTTEDNGPRISGAPNLLSYGRRPPPTVSGDAAGGSGNAISLFRCNGADGIKIDDGSQGSTLISTFDLGKVNSTDNVMWFNAQGKKSDGSTPLFASFSGDVYEIIIFHNFVDDFRGITGSVQQLIDKTEGYLAHKYGLQDTILAPDHPYRVETPTVTETTVVETSTDLSLGSVGINPGADGDERVVRVVKAVSGPDAPKRFVLNHGSTTEFILNPLASPPDSNNQQTPIGLTSSSFDSGLSAVTYGSTILYNYIHNNDATYVQTNKMYEETLNEAKRFIRLPRREFIPTLVEIFQKAISS